VEFVWAGLIVLVIFATGWTTANAMFLVQEEEREPPALTRTDGGDGHTAILYFTHGEPPGYSAQPWIETIRELEHDNVPFIPWLVRPMFFNGVRSEYFEAGGSAHNKLHETFLDNLKRAMPDETAAGTRFYLAFLDSDPRPDEMTIRATNDGASKIIILPVFITESTHTEAGKEMVASVEPEKYGVQTCYTGALWDSEALQQVFVERANEMFNGSDKSKVGILLVGHGQAHRMGEYLSPAEQTGKPIPRGNLYQIDRGWIPRRKHRTRLDGIPRTGHHRFFPSLGWTRRRTNFGLCCEPLRRLHTQRCGSPSCRARCEPSAEHLGRVRRPVW